MIGNDTDGNICIRFSAFIGDSRTFYNTVQYIADCINIKYGIYALHNGGDPFQPHSSIDIRVSEIGIVAVFISGKLCKYMIPEFDITVTVTAGSAVFFSTAVLFSPIIVYLGAWSAGASSNFPEIIIFPKTNDSFFRKTYDIFPDVISLIIFFIYGNPETIFREFENLSH